MSKSDSFFIRAIVTPDNSNTFKTTTIDLGAYVDALGKSVLRIHNVAASITAFDGTAPTMAGDTADFCAWQLSTQALTSLVPQSNRSIVSSGMLWARNPDSTTEPPSQCYESDMLPQDWTNGYLVAVESLQLGAQAGANWTAGSDLSIAIVLECTVETMTQAAAMALALSQQ